MSSSLDALKDTARDLVNRLLVKEGNSEESCELPISPNKLSPKMVESMLKRWGIEANVTSLSNSILIVSDIEKLDLDTIEEHGLA